MYKLTTDPESRRKQLDYPSRLSGLRTEIWEWGDGLNFFPYYYLYCFPATVRRCSRDNRDLT